MIFLKNKLKINDKKGLTLNEATYGENKCGRIDGFIVSREKYL